MRKPLINRATQGLYPLGSLVEPFAKMVLGNIPLNNDEEIQKVYEALGFNLAPTIEIPVAESISNSELEQFHVSPLQVALASAALSNHGTIPAPVIATAVNTPNDGWVVLSAEGTPLEAVQPLAAEDPVVKTASLLLSQAIKAGETDIHISGATDKPRVRIRVDGVLTDKDLPLVPREMLQPVLAHIKTGARRSPRFAARVSPSAHPARRR